MTGLPCMQVGEQAKKKKLPYAAATNDHDVTMSQKKSLDKDLPTGEGGGAGGQLSGLVATYQ